MKKELTTKEKVLNILKQNANTYISGQEIADTLFLTRAGIWKAIKNLRESGYTIESVTNKGYRLVCDYDGINVDFIRNSLPDNLSLKLYSYEEVT